MIGLDFVKHVDKDWKKHITFADGSPYFDDYCPLIGSKCRREDCSFWNALSGSCGYMRSEPESAIRTEIDFEKNQLL